jgi:hypothetical protein
MSSSIIIKMIKSSMEVAGISANMGEKRNTSEFY